MQICALAFQKYCKSMMPSLHSAPLDLICSDLIVLSFLDLNVICFLLLPVYEVSLSFCHSEWPLNSAMISLSIYTAVGIKCFCLAKLPFLPYSFLLTEASKSEAIRTVCLSGLRGWTQVPLARPAWAQIPQVSGVFDAALHGTVCGRRQSKL